MQDDEQSTQFNFFCYANGLFLQHAETADEDIRNEENVEERFLGQVRYTSSRFNSVRIFLKACCIVFISFYQRNRVTF